MLVEIRRKGNTDSYVYYYRDIDTGTSTWEIKENVPEIYTSRPTRRPDKALERAKELFENADVIRRNGYSIVVGYGPKDKKKIRYDTFEFQRVPLDLLESFNWNPIAGDKKISLDIETGRDGNLLCMAIYDGKEVYSYSTEERSQEEMIKDAAELIRRIDPLIIYIHNAAFDLETLRNLGDFKISVDEAEPKIKATLGFTKMMWVYGRIVIDTYGFSRNYSFSTKKNLEQICKEYGITYQKKVHDVWRTWEEDPDLVREYNIEDAIAHYELGEAILPRVIKLANFYQTHPTRVCFTSKRKLAIDKLKRYCYERNGFVPRINESELKTREEFVKTNFRKGYFRQAYMLLPDFDETRELVKAEEATLEVLLNFEDAWWLTKNFGVKKEDINSYKKLLSSNSIINEAYYYFATEQIDGFRCFGECELISVARGKVVGYNGGVFVRGFGINYYPIYTVETLMELAEAFFSGTSLNDALAGRKEVAVPVEDRTIVRKLGVDWCWYTEYAERLDWLREAISRRLKAGEKIFYTYSEEEVKRLTFGKWLKPYIDLMQKHVNGRGYRQMSLF